MCECVQDDVLLREGNVLTLHNASFATAGKYLCEVVTIELPELKRNSFVRISVRGTFYLKVEQ